MVYAISRLEKSIDIMRHSVFNNNSSMPKKVFKFFIKGFFVFITALALCFVAEVALLLSSYQNLIWAKDSGRSIAVKYFNKRTPSNKAQKKTRRKKFTRSEFKTKARRKKALAQAPHLLSIYISSLRNQKHFNLAKSDSEITGIKNFGVAYRFGQWVDSMDLMLRFEYMEYSVSPQISLPDEGESPSSKKEFRSSVANLKDPQIVKQISLIPAFVFPDASSEFPLYFGAAAGMGAFLKQVEGRSKLALHYQLFGGLRIFNIFPRWGFFIEYSRKMMFLAFPTGKLQGNYISLGTISRF